MNARFAILITVVVAACFGIGVLSGRKAGSGQNSTSEGALTTDRIVRLSALPTRRGPSTAAADALSDLARSGEHGLFAKFRGYLRLAADAEINEIPHLIAQIGRDVPDELGGEALIRILAERWVEEDPLGALEALLNLDPAELLEAEYTVLKAIAKSHPLEALRMLQGIDENGGTMIGGALTKGGFADRAVGSLLQETAKNDPALAVEMIISLQRPGGYKAGIMRGLLQLAKTDPARALEAYLAVESYVKLPRGTTSGSDVVRATFHKLAEQNVESAVAAMEGLSRDSRRRAAHGIASHLADSDPAAAFDWIMDLPPDVPRHQALFEVVGRLAARDPIVAAANLELIPTATTRAALSGKIAATWFDEDEDGAIAWARDELEGSTRSAALAEILKEKGDEMTIDEQLELAVEIPGNSSAKNAFAERWAADAPEAAAHWAVAQGDAAPQLFGHVANEWIDTDLEGFAAFATALDNEDLKDIAQQRLERARHRASRRTNQ